MKKDGVKTLTNVRGSIGLWRTWDSEYSYQTDGFKNTYSEFYMVTEVMATYDDYFCLLGQTDEDGIAVIDAINVLLTDSESYTSYTVYNYKTEDGFEKHLMLTSEYDEETVDPYIAEEGEDTSYNPFTIMIAKDKVVIKSIKIA